MSLYIQLFDLKHIGSFFEKSLECFSPSSIFSAITYLTHIRALDAEQNLTTYQKYLSEIPLKPGKALMLLYEILFSCLHPLIIIAFFDELKPFTVSADFLQNDLC